MSSIAFPNVDVLNQARCDVCEICAVNPQAIYCDSCDMAMCNETCNDYIHADEPRNMHFRRPVTASNPPPKVAKRPSCVLCDSCNERPAVVWCETEDLHFCNEGGCNNKWHSAPGKQDHHRFPVARKLIKPIIVGGGEGEVMCELCEEFPAELYCRECDMNFCEENGCDTESHLPMSKTDHVRTEELVRPTVSP